MNRSLDAIKDRFVGYDRIYFVVAFDSGKPTIRAQLFDDYKANRPSMPPLLKEGIPRIREIFDKKGFVMIDAPNGYEADDVIASLAKGFNQKSIYTYIFSSDKDLLQLVNDITTVSLSKAKGGYEDVDMDNFSSLVRGLQPHQIPYLKALAGDKSDNYPGVDGLGDTTASALLRTYGDLDNIYDHLEELSTKCRNRLYGHKDRVLKFLELATLNRDLDLSEWWYKI
ncbi:5'-3' exonuclease-like [Rattus rattus]|uniref:5'-3' exonuclease-like n=1 Tax=Rattus rattus TaxID=10117 RepID=UPI0013F387BA|nr:5'-3' exonuclease-like [Rattus rattus]